MKRKFDLTKTDLRDVAVFASGHTISRAGNGGIVVPFVYSIGKRMKYLFDSLAVGKQAELAQAELAEKLIHKGKEAGVDEMEIKLKNQKPGFKMKAPIDGVEIEVSANAGEDEMLIKVKYK